MKRKNVNRKSVYTCRSSFYTMSLVTLCLTTGIASCDNAYMIEKPQDDKKIVRIIYDCKNCGTSDKRISHFLYSDDNGKLFNAIATDFDGDIEYDRYDVKITYKNHIVRMKGFFKGREFESIFTLKNGLATSCVQVFFDEGYETYYSFQYTDDGYLAEILKSASNDLAMNQSVVFDHSEEGNVVNGRQKKNVVNHDKSYALSYTEEKNKGELPSLLFFDLFNDVLWSYEIAFYADILGKAPVHLAENCLEKNNISAQIYNNICEYSIDLEGYVKMATTTSGNKFTFVFE